MKFKTLKIQFIIFLSLLIIVELFLRINTRPGVLDDSFYPLEKIEYEPRFKGDATGITSYAEGKDTRDLGYIINEEGFRSPFNFNQRTIDSIRIIENKKIIFLIGDSYTEGCCVENIEDSFADLLSKEEKYCILNFGVGGTDLVQYKLIVDKYVKLLQPDLVLIAFYLGNDLVKFDRPPTPNAPFNYTIKNYHWLKSVKAPWYPDDLPKDYFKTHEEAYHFYISKYTLWGENRSTFEKIIRHSVLLSKIYLGVQEKYHIINWKNNNYSAEISLQLTRDLLNKIKSTCAKNEIQLSVIGIPSPVDTKNQVDLKKEYFEYFQDVNHDFPEISLFSKSNYDGVKTGNHFNESGHRIFYEYLSAYLEHEVQ